MPEAIRLLNDAETPAIHNKESNTNRVTHTSHLNLLNRRFAFFADCLRIILSELRAIVRRKSFLLRESKPRPEPATGQMEYVLPTSPRGVSLESDCRSTRSNARKILVVDADYPHPDRDAGSLRMFHMLVLMKDLGYGVKFFATRATRPGAYANCLAKQGVEIVVASTRFQMLRWWYRHGSEFDVVLLSRLPVALESIRHVRRYAKQASIIFDTVDLHFLRISREASLHGDREKEEWARELREYELGCWRSFKTDQLCSLKIDQGKKAEGRSLGCG